MNGRHLGFGLGISTALLATFFWWPKHGSHTEKTVRRDAESSADESPLRDARGSRATQALMAESETPERARLWNELTRASAEMRATLSDEKRFPELAECRVTPEPRCEAVLSEAVRIALGWPVKAGIIERFKADPTPFDARALRDLASDVLSTSSEPELRAPLIVMLDIAKTYQVASDVNLAPAAYTRLPTLTATEKALLLREYTEAPLNDAATVERVRDLALAPHEDKSVRGAALGALAALGSGAEVATALDSLRTSGALKELPPVELGRMLARCGVGCEQSIVALAGSADSAERLASLDAIASAGKRLPASVADAVYAKLPPEAQRSDEEQDQVRYLYEHRFAAR